MTTKSVSSTEPIAIIGAGLTGSMMGLMLARRGYEVEIYEKRSDFRKSDGDTSTRVISR